LKDIIEQIVQIDAMACENKKKNEELLIKKRNDYENEITKYKNQKIALAKYNAEIILKNQEKSLEKEEILIEDKISMAVLNIDMNYSQVEQKIMEKLFKKLFVLEG